MDGRDDSGTQNGSSVIEVLSTGHKNADIPTGNAPKKRGRPKGSKNRTRIVADSSSDTIRPFAGESRKSGEGDATSRGEDGTDGGRDSGRDSGRDGGRDNGRAGSYGDSYSGNSTSSRRKPGRPPKRLVSVEEPTVRLALMQLAQFHQLLKPVELRELWQISEEEIYTVSEPLAKTLQSLPDKYLKLAESALNMANPIAAIIAAAMIVLPRSQQEKRYIETLRFHSTSNASANFEQNENGHNPGYRGNSRFYGTET